MGEKTKVPSITDTMEIDGVYYIDQHVDLNTPELRSKKSPLSTERLLLELR
ncbi:hypothetical protein [Vibrio cyclitrophicus]|uniref:hypothetical protein n=1 Tax=Vibrio cyclitrophicus TaxID=47951 RepID=UPI00399AAB33